MKSFCPDSPAAVEWSWNPSASTGCENIEAHSGSVNLSKGHNLTVAVCKGDYGDVSKLSCARTDSGSLTSGLVGYREFDKGKPVSTEGCSPIVFEGKPNSDFGSCCFKSTSPPAFPTGFNTTTYRTDGSDGRRIFSCKRVASKKCAYPGPDPKNWSCSNFSSVQPSCTDNQQRCGECVYEHAGIIKQSGIERSGVGLERWVHRVRFCAEDGSKVLLTEYKDGNCLQINDKRQAPLETKLAHQCTIDGHCSAKLPHYCRKEPRAPGSCQGYNKNASCTKHGPKCRWSTIQNSFKAMRLGKNSAMHKIQLAHITKLA